MRSFGLAAGGYAIVAAVTPAGAQQPAPEQPAAERPPVSSGASGEEAGDEEIVVTGQRLPGSVVGDIPPEVTLSPGDIRSYGVSSLADLINELAPQTGSTQGRGGEAPVVLLNGKRISGFAEIRDLPTEAIQRVEILPEEVALKYGYRPNQKVVNVVLRRRFNAVTAEAEAGAPTEGGRFSPELDLSTLRIAGNDRLNLTAEYQRSSALTEGERDIVAQSPSQPFAIGGNIGAGLPGAEIDPRLSALLGTPATVAGVPAVAATRAPTLADFAGAGVKPGDIGRFRTLLPATEQLRLNAVLARTIFGDVSASFNGSLTLNRSDSRQGLATARLALPAGTPFSPFASDVLLYRYLDEYDPLRQRTRDGTGHLGTTLNGTLGTWTWTFTGTYDHAESRTRTVRGFDLSGVQARIAAGDPALNPFAPLAADFAGSPLVDRARSRSDVADGELVLTGTPFRLPAGAATATAKLGGSYTGLSARALRSGIASGADLSRRGGEGQLSVDLPIASARAGVLSPLGELSANLNAGYERLSDFGGLRTLGAGINWKPTRPLSLIASWNREEGAPTVQQLGNPLVTTLGVRTFDYVRGETVDIARVTGGNPLLRADDRTVMKLQGTLRPFGNDLSIIATYTRSRIDDPIAVFPAATAAIESAFPDRFTRDADGRLLRIDARPINFARQEQEDVRWGVNFSKQLSAPPRPAGGEGQPALRDAAGGPPREGGRPGGFGRFGGGGFGGRGTRLQLAVYHTVHLREEVRLFDGGPTLDLLDGDALAATGGQPRHEVEAQAGLTRDGIGGRLSANWRSATRVDGGLTSTDALRFSPLATINLRLFANLGQQRDLVERMPFLRGSRLTLSVTNILNDRQRVRGTDGITPIGLQPDYLDPLGRSIRLSFRKLFFTPPPPATRRPQR